uniref:Telomeric repeat-binding factor 2-interacting protein 1 n=1 Tax=Sphenodon punctatus TaxID=8508 RepID=A0A8D0GD89_SPHPU
AVMAAARSASLLHHLFQQDDGSAMHFYVRPGPAKLEVGPLILRGGGQLCSVQEPGVLVLAQPGDLPPKAARNVISKHYITDCVAQNKRLPLEHYRLLPAKPKLLTAQAAGRMHFTEAEDRAILLYVQDKGRVRAIAGAALWKEMEQARLTRHSWQAMRDHYLKQLKGREHVDLLELGAPPPSSKRKAPAADLPDQEEGKEEVVAAKSQTGLFQVANQEFEDHEISDLLEPNSPKDTEAEIPKGPALSPKMRLAEFVVGEDSAASESSQPQQEERSSSTFPSLNEVADAAKDIQRFMEEFSLDLATVTQAFLKNSGEVEATSSFLQTGQRLDGFPIWRRQDDLDLLKDEDNDRNQLIVKFGADNVMNRIAFRRS